MVPSVVVPDKQHTFYDCFVTRFRIKDSSRNEKKYWFLLFVSSYYIVRTLFDWV